METIKETRHEIVSNIDNAFDFIQKLYYESSYLIKEIEGQLAINEVKFQILRPSGYGINTSKSTGLEINYVNSWLIRKFGVAFVEEPFTESNAGVTSTKILPKLKALYFRVILNDKTQKEPRLIYCVFHDIEKKKENINKFENLISYFESNDLKIFNSTSEISFENPNFKIKGKFKEVSLLDINTSEELVRLVIKPALKIYSEI